MYTILSVLFALQLSWTWLHRGGSMPWKTSISRIDRLLATPLVLVAALCLAYQPQTSIEAIALMAGAVLFGLAQVWGWLDASDLGADGDRPVWKEWLLLYARMLMFAPAAVALYFYHPLSAIIPMTTLLMPIYFWLDRKFDWQYWWNGKVIARAELVVGVTFMIATLGFIAGVQ